MEGKGEWRCWREVKWQGNGYINVMIRLTRGIQGNDYGKKASSIPFTLHSS